MNQVKINNLEILEYQINDNCKFIVIASDGVWEFLDNNQVIDFVAPYYKINDIDGAVDRLINVSTDYWMKVILSNIGR